MVIYTEFRKEMFMVYISFLTITISHFISWLLLKIILDLKEGVLTNDSLSVSNAPGTPWAFSWRPAPASVGFGEMEVENESRVGPTVRQGLPGGAP